MRLRVVAPLCASLLVWAAVAAAAEPVDDSTRNAARNLAEQGRTAFDQGEFERSRDLFQRAYALVQAPTLALYEARSLAKLGRWVEAEEAYLRAIRAPLGPSSPEAFRKAARDAEAEQLQLEPRVPKVTIVVSGPGARAADLVVKLDQQPLKAALIGVEMPLDPGRHVVEAKAQGAPPSRVEFAIAEKERQTVDLPVAAAPAPLATSPTLAPPVPSAGAAKSSWQRPAAFVAGGVGLAGLGTGLVTGLMAGSAHAKAEEQCPNHTCVEGTEGADAVSSFRSLRTVSTVGYVVGAVGVAASVTLFLIAPSPHREQRASLGVWMNAGSAGLKGSF